MRTRSDNPAPVPRSLRGRLDLLVKANHYVIGRVTLMDLTVIAVFFPAVAADCLGAGVWCSCLVSALFCLVTVRLRIRHRRYKTLRYMCDSAEKAVSLLREYVRLAEAAGDEELAGCARAALAAAEKSAGMLADDVRAAFIGDVLGLADEGDEDDGQTDL